MHYNYIYIHIIKLLLHMLSYAVLPHNHQVQQHPPVALTAAQAGIPGLQLHLDFITPEQEAALLQQIEQQPWQQLSKRRVQHYGYCFDYSQRGVDAQQRLGPLPKWVQPLVQRMEVRSSRGAVDVCMEVHTVKMAVTQKHQGERGSGIPGLRTSSPQMNVHTVNCEHSHLDIAAAAAGPARCAAPRSAHSE
jgi:hypothetical protein